VLSVSVLLQIAQVLLDAGQKGLALVVVANLAARERLRASERLRKQSTEADLQSRAPTA
jgi:hypothetical protein